MEEGTFDPSIPYNLEAARFSFMGILQNKLDKTVNSWNNYCVRSVRNTECPEVQPHVLPGELPGISYQAKTEQVIVAFPLNDLIE